MTRSGLFSLSETPLRCGILILKSLNRSTKLNRMRRKKEIDRPSSLSVVSAADEAISARWRYVFKNWYEIPGMIRIVVFALIGQGSNIYDGFITVGVMLRFLAILYLIKLSRSVEDKSRILGGQVVLQIFIIFFLTLVILSLVFYSAEHSAPNSEITNIGDALWWTIQTPLLHLDPMQLQLKGELWDIRSMIPFIRLE